MWYNTVFLLGSVWHRDMPSAAWLISALTHLSLCARLQEDTPVREPVVEEYEDDLLEDLYHNLSVSTVTVGPNVTEYEVG